MRSCLLPLLSLSLAILIVECAWGQDVEQLVDDFRGRFEDPIQLSGQFGLQFQGYGTSLTTNRAAPFNAAMNANISIGVLGVQTPLNFIYSSGGTAYNITLPSFGFAGISPSYRDYTLHLGDRSLTMGKYSFSNHSFRGLGWEIQKERWYVKTFYGRLQRAQANDYQGFQNIDPLFRRMGWGTLIGAKPSESSKVEVSLFRAWDDPNSITTPDSALQATPSENVILSTLVEQRIGKRIRFAFNFSNSGYTASRQLEDPRSASVFRSFAGLLLINTSTRWNNALELSTHYNAKIGTVNLTYERIDPGYRTMGALFFQDDQENITAGISTHLWKKRVSLIANGGIQNNNLNSDRAQEYARFLGSLQMNATPTKWLNLNIGYSNFSSVDRQIRILDPEAPAQLTELALSNGNFSVNATAMITSADIVTANFSSVRSQTITQDEVINEQKNEVNNITLFYRKSWPLSKFHAGLQVYHNTFKMEVLEQNQSGLALVLGQPLLNQSLNLNLNISYANNRQISRLDAMERQGDLLQVRPRISWQLNKVHTIQCDGSVLRNSGGSIQDYFEARIRVSYTARFQKVRK